MLTIYKASAGSGKTFRLAVEYIKRLIANPRSYRHILAVTFTNKATEEMKMRILSQLYGIAHGLHDSDVYINVMLPELQQQNEKRPFTNGKVDENFVRERATEALRLLLHHYNFFRVETIDRFFQTVLRNLARELDLTPNLRIELNDKEIEYEAVDRWIDSLQENDRELIWILDYIRSSMDEEKAWNIIGQIKSFGETLISDEYKEHAEEFMEKFGNAGNDNDFYTEYSTLLRSIIQNSNKAVNSQGQEMWDEIERHGYDETVFYQGAKGVGTFIRNMALKPVKELSVNSYVSRCLDTEDTDAGKWVKKTSPAHLKDFCREILRPMFLKAMESFFTLQIQARSAEITLKHLSKLRLLRAIKEEIDLSNREQDRFLLSDTQTLLAKMIEDSDSPFIFEKIGALLQSIMIDEFQDTSRIQWRNFKVLLNDCMAKGHDNLIVGDVKQSIYRWRSGDWRLLNNINEEFNKKTQETIDIRHLQINRRSSTKVIQFNNAFFTEAAGIVHESVKENCDTKDAGNMKQAYEDVEQKFPEGKTVSGYVEVRLFDKENYEEDTMRYVADTVISLIEKGARQRDIAILVRTNSHIPDIVSYCMETFRTHPSPVVNELKLVSNEAFLLNASPAAVIIIDAIRLLMQPQDDIIKARLSLYYQRYVLRSTAIQPEILTNLLLPQRLTDNLESLASMPLYQLCEELYSIFSLEQMDNQSAFVCCFLDCVTEFLQKSMGDLQSFINYWDETMHKKKVESDSDNGIRILTIHKSKGLEYRHVIIPFCDWKLELPSLLWCKPPTEPFNRLKVIPIYSNAKQMCGTIYESYYWEEHLQNEVDNLNLLYVGFTRAVENLFISTQAKQSKNFRGKLIEDTVSTISAKGIGTYNDGLYSFGESWQGHTEKSEKETRNVFMQPFLPMTINIKTNTRQPEFLESNRSKDFILTDEQEGEQLRSQYIQMGNILHALFAGIRTSNEIPSALLRLEMEGLLYGQDITAEALRQQIETALSNPQIAEWFSDKWKIYNECSILTYDKESDTFHEQRPDRVMTDGKRTIVIDFKLRSFKECYKTQVQQYMSLLRKMGHKNVSGYLWLVFSNKVIEVKD
ncbi:MAG: UvrD-helicase domain-containing protein [Bacteroidales bacterium]|nr:UvrD-helicase domain-containing protein [Bacteroidales bacterium]MCM1147340.1 UvrD-helicase domain-containing protein [Bacteroidales bacterium]MCM1206224.1 UvrD-helicase domain-containing protein [Bacillota bacterium]MCM1510458.1 UvrD-helicase domain-containing protein [Clostridium sp.]